MKNWWIFHSHVSSFTRGYPSVTYSYPWVNPISYPIVTPCAKGLNVQWLTEPGLSSCWSQASRPKLGEICSLYLYKIQITNHGFKRKRIHKWLNFHNNLQISTVSNYYQWLHNHNQLYFTGLISRNYTTYVCCRDHRHTLNLNPMLGLKSQFLTSVCFLKESVVLAPRP